MANPVANLLGRNMRHSVAFYLASFPRSYESFGGPPDLMREQRLIYQDAVEARLDDILSATHGAINRYLSSYGIHVSAPDQFKIIYFVGWAIHHQLKDAGLENLQPISLFSMIGMLDSELLAQAGIVRPPLTEALTRAARRYALFDELGPIGTYLVYKTMTNAVRDVFSQRPI